MYRTSIRGTFAVSRQAARRVRDGGAIVNFSSTLTRRSIPAYAACNAGNAAVEDLTLLLTRELRGRDITVNAVVPGPAIVEVAAFLVGPGRCINGQVIDANADFAARNAGAVSGLCCADDQARGDDGGVVRESGIGDLRRSFWMLRRRMAAKSWRTVVSRGQNEAAPSMSSNPTTLTSPGMSRIAPRAISSLAAKMAVMSGRWPSTRPWA
jgi:NAD(P)-dependent dehydrogenase (short-subunit alcohol dehydrogenase family)